MPGIQATLEIDEGPAVKAVAAGNRELLKFAQVGVKSVGEVNAAFSVQSQVIQKTEERLLGATQRVSSLRDQIDRLNTAARDRAIDSLAAKLKAAQEAGDPRGIERLTQSLNRAQEAARKFDLTKELKTAQATARNVSNELGRVQQQGQFAGLTERIRAGLQNPMGAAGDAVTSFLGKFGLVGAVLTAAGVGAVAFGAKLFQMTDHFGKAAEQTVNLADRLNITVGQAETLSHVADIAGVNVGALEGASRVLSVALEDSAGAGKKAVDALGKLGISTVTVAGESRDLGEVTVELLERLSKIPSASERIALANATLGKGAKELLPLIKNYGALKEQVEALRIVDPELTKKLAGADDQIDFLKKRWDSFVKRILEHVSVPFFEDLTFILKKLDEFEAKNVNRKTLGAGGSFGGDSGELGREAALSELQSQSIAEQAAAANAIESQLILNDAINRGAPLAKRFAAEHGRSLDGISRRIEALKKDQLELVGVLSGRGIGAEGFQEKQKLFDANRTELSQLEQRKQKIEEGAAAVKRADVAVRQAQQAEKEGIGKILIERSQNLTLLEGEIDGQKRKTAAAQFELATQIQIATEVRKLRRAQLQKEFGLVVDQTLGDIDRRAQLDAQAVQERDRLFGESEQRRFAAFEQIEDLKVDRLAVSRDAELRSLDLINTRTVAEKLAVEGRKFEIERKFMAQAFDLQIANLVRRSQLEILEKQRIAREAGASEGVLEHIRLTREEGLAADVAKLSQDTNAAIAAARDKATIQSVQFARDANQKLFDHLKDASAQVFDAMLQGGKQFWNAWKNLALTAFRDVMSSAVARALMPLFGGQPGAVQGGGGILGRLGGLGGLAGAGGVIPNIGPGGTPPFVPGNTAGVLGAPATGGGVGAAGGLGGSGKLLGSLSNLGNIGISPSSGGIGGAAGGGLLLGGGVLAAMGLKRGGLSGLAMTTGGGALIGAKFGGPGAAIGAGVGFAAGLVRLFIKGAEEKAIQKVRQVYGLVIDKNLAKQIVEIGRSTFGGNLDMAIGSPPVRELLELYAMSTGQKFSGQASAPRSFTAGVSGGRIFEQQGFSALGSPLGRQLLGNSGGGAAQAQTINLSMNLDKQATTDIFDGRLVKRVNARSVAKLSEEGQRASSRRRETVATQLSPGLVVA